MKLVGDISVFQTHNYEWTAWQPIDLAVYASHVDAVWVRWSDWSAYVRWGRDPGYVECIEQLRDHKPVGAYLFPRPGWTNPAEQVRTWHSQTPATTFAPMLDPEHPEGLRGPALTGWIDAALAEMTQLWQAVPWLYTQKSKVDAWGLSRPSTPHHLMLAGYNTNPVYPWGGDWRAQSFTGGEPPVPDEWSRWDCWQFTEKAEIPGMAGLVDASWVRDDVFDASVGGGDDGFTVEHGQALDRIHRAWVGQ